MPELDLECLSTELFILAFNLLASEVLLCKLLSSWYLVLYFFGWIVDFYYVGIHSPMCIFYLNFINCSILALLLTAVTCFLSRIWRCCRSELSAKITDGPLRLFENSEYFFVVSFELISYPNPILSQYFWITNGVRVHLSRRFMYDKESFLWVWLIFVDDFRASADVFILYLCCMYVNFQILYTDILILNNRFYCYSTILNSHQPLLRWLTKGHWLNLLSLIKNTIMIKGLNHLS